MPSAELGLTLRPESDLRRIGEGRWHAAAGPVRFVLHASGGSLPSGWVLMTTRISRALVDGTAELTVEHPAGTLQLPIPVSRNGWVFELIHLPKGVQRMTWRPSGRAGEFEHGPVRLAAIGWPRRLWLMLRRAGYMLWTRLPEHRARVGLSWAGLLHDLPAQYRAAGSLRSHRHDIRYDEWLELYARLTSEDRRLIERRIRRLARRPHFAVILLGEDAATRRFVHAQIYRDYSIVAAHPESSPSLPPQADYGVLLGPGDRLAEDALYWMAEAVAGQPSAALVYADDDLVLADGQRSDPRFKPDWSPEHLRSIDYIGRGAAIRRRELEAALRGGGRLEDTHGVLLRASSGLRAEQVVHVPAPLVHLAATMGRPGPLKRRQYALPQTPPLVSVIVPTRDGLRLLRRCLDSVRLRSTYTRIEVIIVDNESREPETLGYLDVAAREPGTRVLRYAAPFNFAAMNNLAARAAQGEVLVLLNNDTEIITPGWIEEMLGHLTQPGVGAVGAKLYYPDGTVQHAGDAVGIGGCADHLHNGLAHDAPGYFHRSVVAHEVSAVTAACLMVRRHVYLELGGLDERRLPVSFNDVDFCLRVQRAGWRVVFTPHAELLHFESATRPLGAGDAAAARIMRRRWRARLREDPFYNPNCDNEIADFALAVPPRVRKPWWR
jgi:GT2 family glycosyltransferase